MVKKIDIKAVGIIAFFVLFYFIHNFVWLQKTADFPLNDFLHYNEMTQWYDSIKQGRIPFLNEQLSYVNHYVPLYFFLPVICRLFFETGYHFNIMFNIIYFALLLICLYFFTKKMYGKTTALLAVSLVSLYPGIYCTSRFFYIEFGLLWIVVFSIYMLIQSDYFSNRKYSILSGIAVGIGLMIKATYTLFIFPLFFYFLIMSLWRAIRDKEKEIFFNIIICNCIWCAIAGWKYFRLHALRQYFMNYVIEGGGSIFDYAGYLHNVLLQPSFLIVFLISVVWFLVYERKERKIIFLLLLLPAFLYHSLMLHLKMSRYILPLLPTIAVVSAWWLNSIKWKKIKWGICGILILYGFIQYYVTSFHCFTPLIEKGFITPAYKCDANEFMPKDNLYDKIVTSLNNCNIAYKEDFTFLLLPVVKEIDSRNDELSYMTDEGTFFIWYNILLLKKVPFNMIQIYEGLRYDMSLRCMQDNFTKSDGILYIGYSDLKKGNNFETYLNFLMEKTNEILLAVINDHRVLVDPKMEQEIQSVRRGIKTLRSSIENSFPSFKLIETVTIVPDDKPINLYIYKR